MIPWQNIVAIQLVSARKAGSGKTKQLTAIQLRDETGMDTAVDIRLRLDSD